MLRKIGCSLLCAGALFSAKTLAMTYMFTSPGVSIEYQLPPNEPVIFANSWFWTITAICTTHIEGPHTELYAEMISKKITRINGKVLTQGDPMSMVIHHGEKLSISADSGARVKLINRGAYLVRAHCST